MKLGGEHVYRDMGDVGGRKIGLGFIVHVQNS